MVLAVFLGSPLQFLREGGRASSRKAPLCTVGIVGRNETTVTPP